MTQQPRPATPPCLARKGFSLLEVTVSTLLVGTLLTAALSSMGRVALSRGSTGDLAYANELAFDLLAEATNLPYEDPTAATGALGAESGEVSGNRSLFDDVDDFHTWAESPPQDPSGTLLSTSTTWRREVAVDYVDPLTPSQSSLGVDRGVKRVTVTVRRSGVTVCVLRALRVRNYAVQ